LLLNGQWVIDEIKREIKTFLEANESERTVVLSKTFGIHQKQY
jgi:hypothetical protein